MPACTQPGRTALLIVAAVVPALLSVIGCGGESAPVNSADSSGPRIVSLSPAVTQMLRDLGRDDAIVGVGEFDPVSPDHARIVGDLRNIDYEGLLALRPTAVLLQPGHVGVPARLQRLADRVGFAVHSFDIETLDDALDALRNAIGDAAESPDAADALADGVEDQLARLAELTADREPVRVLLLVGLGPYATAAGRGTFLDEMLHVAGALNALDERPLLYPELDHEQLLAVDPDLIIHMTSSAGGPGGRMPDPLADRFRSLEDEAALLPSTSLPRVAVKLVALVHPDLHDQAKALLEPVSPQRSVP
ncbi:MAG: helical backbone metal receptor [Phycisphaeraceae bacterium]